MPLVKEPDHMPPEQKPDQIEQFSNQPDQLLNEQTLSLHMTIEDLICQVNSLKTTNEILKKNFDQVNTENTTFKLRIKDCEEQMVRPFLSFIEYFK